MHDRWRERILPNARRARGAFILAAVGWVLVLAAGGSLARATPSAAERPVQVVHVAWGSIGFRAVGHGRPLVLLSGGGDTIAAWAPSFIDALARHRRVLAFDTEGAGLTTLRSGMLTVTRMADDAATFIAARHLVRPDVLGWSQGGMVAQALAVNHPRSIRRVILCATVPGNGDGALGTVMLPPGSVAGLFPADREAARRAFLVDLARYHEAYRSPAPTQGLDATATSRWLHGLDPAGKHLDRLRAPTLIGAGADDPLVPVFNSHILAARIHRARLKIYPDAAHGFLFQNAADWVARIDRFLR